MPEPLSEEELLKQMETLSPTAKKTALDVLLTEQEVVERIGTLSPLAKQTALKSHLTEEEVLDLLDTLSSTAKKTTLDVLLTEQEVVERMGALSPLAKQTALKTQLTDQEILDLMDILSPPAKKAALRTLTDSQGFDTTQFSMKKEDHVKSLSLPDGTRSKTPKLPVFSGEKKKDSSFARWQYNVKVLQNGPYDEYSILDAITQSLKSPAADIVMSMGHRVSVNDILRKLGTHYGCVLSVEALTEKLYQLKQGTEDLSSWAHQIEEVIFQLEEKKGINHREVEGKVKGRFWCGLKDSRIKEATRAAYDTISFDELLVMCRTLEEEYGIQKTASVQQQTSVEKKIDRLLGSFEKLEARVKSLEKTPTNAHSTPSTPRGSSHPTGERRKAFCTKCKAEGHLFYGCRKNNPNVVCERCHKQGHLKNCCRVHLN